MVRKGEGPIVVVYPLHKRWGENGGHATTGSLLRSQGLATRGLETSLGSENGTFCSPGIQAPWEPVRGLKIRGFSSACYSLCRIDQHR